MAAGEGHAPAKVSPWAPFAHSAFALLWTATLISNIGTWMHDVGAGWLMTTLNPAPAVVALVQAATTLPVFIFVLLAGALADRVDKRRLLLIVNLLLVAVIALFTGLVVLQSVTPAVLILFTFLIGTGTAFIAPAWQAIVPQLVPREKLQPAIALNSMGINISRAIGPAVGGFLIAAVGIAAPFAINAVSCIAVVVAVLLWRPPAREKPKLPPEPLLGSIVTGLRHAGYNAPLKATLLRAFGFFIFASAYWSMLPLVARAIPGGGAELYGLMMTAIGLGAVVGALSLPRIRQRVSSDRVAVAATVGTAAAMAILATVEVAGAAVAAAFAGGVAWIAMLTSLNVSAQTALPNWVRARGLSLFLMVFSGCMAGGSTLWGQVASATSVPAALIAAALGALALLPFIRHHRLGQGEELDLTPAMSWDAPDVAAGFKADFDRGPVLITIEYVVDPDEQTPFLRAVHALSAERYRDGAYDWGAYQDSADPRLWTEWFLVSSWAEHLRQHERTTKEDEDLHNSVRKFHRGPEKPRVRHFLAPEAGPFPGPQAAEPGMARAPGS